MLVLPPRYTSGGETSVQETTIVGYPTALTLVLTNDEWDDPTNRTIPNAPDWENWGDVLERIYTDQPETMAAWRALIATRVTGLNLIEKTSPRRLTISLPETPAYQIVTPETISFSIPATATRSRTAYLNAGSFVIRAVDGDMYVTGDTLTEVRGRRPSV